MSRSKASRSDKLVDLFCLQQFGDDAGSLLITAGKSKEHSLIMTRICPESHSQSQKASSAGVGIHSVPPTWECEHRMLLRRGSLLYAGSKVVFVITAMLVVMFVTETLGSQSSTQHISVRL